MVELGSSNSWGRLVGGCGDLGGVQVAARRPHQPGRQGGEQEELLAGVGLQHEVVPGDGRGTLDNGHLLRGLILSFTTISFS